jgi:hypothetical protein
MILVMKKNFINQKIYIGISTRQYWGAWKKNKIFGRKFHLLSSTWILFFKMPQILGLFQVLASSVNKHDYKNLAFEVHANKS